MLFYTCKTFESSHIKIQVKGFIILYFTLFYLHLQFCFNLVKIKAIIYFFLMFFTLTESNYVLLFVNTDKRGKEINCFKIIHFYIQLNLLRLFSISFIFFSRH